MKSNTPILLLHVCLCHCDFNSTAWQWKTSASTKFITMQSLLPYFQDFTKWTWDISNMLITILTLHLHQLSLLYYENNFCNYILFKEQIDLPCHFVCLIYQYSYHLFRNVFVLLAHWQPQFLFTSIQDLSVFGPIYGQSKNVTLLKKSLHLVSMFKIKVEAMPTRWCNPDSTHLDGLMQTASKWTHKIFNSLYWR